MILDRYKVDEGLLTDIVSCFDGGSIDVWVCDDGTAVVVEPDAYVSYHRLSVNPAAVEWIVGQYTDADWSFEDGFPAMDMEDYVPNLPPKVEPEDSRQVISDLRKLKVSGDSSPVACDNANTFVVHMACEPVHLRTSCPVCDAICRKKKERSLRGYSLLGINCPLITRVPESLPILSLIQRTADLGVNKLVRAFYLRELPNSLRVGKEKHWVGCMCRKPHMSPTDASCTTPT
jgi:hypothetical protein